MIGVARRRVLGSREIPISYDAEVEYLESTGTQYIETGIVCSTSHEIRATMMVHGEKKTGNAYTFFGQGYAYNNSNIELYSANNYKDKISCLINGNTDISMDYTQLFNVTIANKVFTFTDGNGNVIGTADRSSITDFIAPFTMTIFALHRQSIAKSANPVRCYAFQILLSGSLILDLIPVRIGTTGYMYDRISGQLFGNSGTGSFVLGKDKELPYDAEIAYIESTGTQWLDTGVIPTDTTVCRLKFINTQKTGQVLFGFHDGEYASYRLFNNPSTYFDTIRTNGQYRLPTNAIPININTEYEIELGNKYIKDVTSGTVVNGSAYSGTYAKSLTLNYYSDTYISKNKWISVKIYEGAELVLDLVPVRVAQVGYMYDRVSGQLFGNAGTGDFVLGPDV